MFDFIYTILALTAYAAAFWYLFIHLMAKTQPNLWLLGLLFSLGLGLHGTLLYQHMLTPAGINYDISNVISFTSALMLLLSIGFSCYRPVLALNLLGIPVAMFGLVIGASFSPPTQLIQQQSFGLDIHIILSLSAYAVLLMATIHALLMWIQNRELKKKQKRLWVNLLPSVQTMERLLFDLIITGFATLTLALAVGLLTVEDILGQHVAHKTFFSIVSWIVYGTLLIGHYYWGWRGKKAIHFTIIGFALLALGFIGSKFVLEMILGR
ncbi:inner membrane protein YpjD [Moraxella sp. ZY210820]|uniref:cytochrome C assembly family protein n=1 Tax=unclassified Moraxella TaxID=2685852 RepID=UPI00272F07F8|nr:cytochrome c biogenesis protein CcsA [Moraxella sp. ZY210820]WLF84737.1 cytochrome c biogenesis protein CcsA [Moraxella sp. ZY210820]